MTWRRMVALACWMAMICVPVAAPAEIRIMTFNLRYHAVDDQGTWKQWASTNQAPQRRDLAVRLITNRMPDLIGLQEGENDQLDDLAARLPGYLIERRLPSGGSGSEHAAFAYNTNTLQLTDCGVFSLGPSPGGGCWNNPPGTNFNPYLFFPDMGMGFPRLAIWGRFVWRATGQPLLFYSTHMDFNSNPQVNSARLISEDARARNAFMPRSPLAIVVGDFNACQTNNSWKFFTGAYSTNGITGDFTDSWYQVKGTWSGSGTFHGWDGSASDSERIDWILHRGGIVATQVVIIKDTALTTNLTTHAVDTMYPSDHFPVYADLRLPGLLSDFDGDDLPDTLEMLSNLSLPTAADTDGDGLADGLEDLNGNGVVEGGETDPSAPGDTQLPTDIRYSQMDGLLDHSASLLAENGMRLYYRFDGRYLLVAADDAGEGSDHFIFITRAPESWTPAPWAKAGTVPVWDAYLADENDSSYIGWFDAAGAEISDTSRARRAVCYENGHYMEGVIDLAALYGPGFTNPFYLAAAPYGSADGGALVTSAQVPAGNGNGDIWGYSEVAAVTPADTDHDGINDLCDPDADGNGLPDTWEDATGIVGAPNGLGGATGDYDGDGFSNRDELWAGSHPAQASSSLNLAAARETPPTLRWTAGFGRVYKILSATNLAGTVVWTPLHTVTNRVALTATNSFAIPEAGPEARFYRLSTPY